MTCPPGKSRHSLRKRYRSHPLTLPELTPGKSILDTATSRMLTKELTNVHILTHLGVFLSPNSQGLQSLDQKGLSHA